MFDFIMERLKLLDYNHLLLKEVKLKPISRYYFLKPNNSGEQFFMFVSICAFCFRKIGKDFKQPEEEDDPTPLLLNILKYLEELNIQIDFPPNKLMQGAGPNCVYVMECLTKLALKINRTHLPPPEIIDENEPIPEIMESTNEIILEKLEEEFYYTHDDDDETDGGFLQNINNKLVDVLPIANQKNKEQENLQELSSELWSLELERSFSQLKIIIKPDPRDWRSHWYQMKQFRDNIITLADETYVQLKKLQSEIVYVSDKIEIREMHLNTDLRPTIGEYVTVSGERSKIDLSTKEVKSEVTELDRAIEKTVHDYKTVKDQMEQRGTSMMDGSPLINLKKAITKVKEEIIQMNLEICIIQHGIDQETFRQNALFSQIKA